MRNLVRGYGLTVKLAWRSSSSQLVLAFAFSVITAVAQPLFALWLKLLVDGVIAGDLAQVTWAAVLLALSDFGLRVLWNFSWPIEYTLQERVALAVDELSVELQEQMPSLEHHERPDYHDKLMLVRNERKTIHHAIRHLIQAAGLVAQVASTVALLLTVDPLLLLLPLLAVPALYCGRLEERIYQASRERTAQPSRLAQHLFSMGTDPESGKEVRVFGLASELVRRHVLLWNRVTDDQIRAELRGGLVGAAGWAIFALGYVGAIVLVIQRAIQGSATVGDVVLALALAGQLNGQVTRSVQLVSSFLRTNHTLGRLLWMIDYAKAAAQAPPDPAPVPDRIVQGVRFEDVTFRYPGTDQDVLSGVNAFLPAGSTVAIVGENGAGKTTLVKLLLRYYDPTAGRITVDGVDIARFHVKEWRERIAGAFQDFVRFEVVAREGVGFGDVPAMTDVPRVQAALERAGGSDVLTALPDGLETQLGTIFDGQELSGGQWQKVALGRAMMREQALLLVLDEPTSALDAHAEHALFQRYAHAARRGGTSNGAVTIVVSHRFSTVRMADVIIVLQEGGLVESGSHSELTSRAGLYAELYELQARTYR